MTARRWELASMDKVRFYFSFRSPYAWFAFHRLPAALEGLPVEIEYVPVYPTDDFPNDPSGIPSKIEYMMRHDLPRLSAAYGLKISRPAELDCDWAVPHAMWCYANEQGKGDAFGKAIYAARFSKSQSLDDEATLREAAEICQLDPDAALAAGSDRKYQERVEAGWKQGASEDGLFGVPTFVYRGERFWGHDRTFFLVQAIRRANDLPELALDPAH
jgi:2-hydroxychromene-2-carboxylate isomerase